jgi:hypothetical protein
VHFHRSALGFPGPYDAHQRAITRQTQAERSPGSQVGAQVMVGDEFTCILQNLPFFTVKYGIFFRPAALKMNQC